MFSIFCFYISSAYLIIHALNLHPFVLLVIRNFSDNFFCEAINHISLITADACFLNLIVLAD